MGIITSKIAAAKRKLQPLRSKIQAKKRDKKSPTGPSQPPPSFSAQQEVEEGLYDEHLASTAPPILIRQATATDKDFEPTPASAPQTEKVATTGTAAATVS